MSYMESVVSQLRYEWRDDIRQEINDALDQADRAAEKRTNDMNGAIRNLIEPFTKDWRMGAASGLLLVVGVVMQTAGSLLAL
jgi:hypothetical protein